MEVIECFGTDWQMGIEKIEAANEMAKDHQDRDVGGTTSWNGNGF